MQNPFADLIPNSAPQAPPIVAGTPDPRRAAAERRAEEAASRAERAEARASIPSGYRMGESGNLEFIPGGPADPATPRARSTRQLPQTAIDRLSDGTSGLMALERAAGGFRDEYAGNTITGRLENWGQALNENIGTPGQNQWWQDVYSTDNFARNALFGASLTQGEKDAWERTTVNPSMDPAQVRANLTRRAEIARGALRRLSRTYAANGYSQDAIEESLGELAPAMLDREEQRNEAGAPPTGGSPITPQNAGPGGDTTTQYQNGGTFATERDRQVAANVQQMLNRGVSVERVNRYIVQQGYPPWTIQQMQEIGQGRRSGSPFNVGVPESGVQEERNTLGALIADNLPSPVGAFASGATDTLTLGAADEIAGAASGLNSLISGDGYTDAYNRTVGNFREARDVISRDNPISYLSGQVAGGFALPTGRVDSIRRLMAVGGGYGGAYGFNSADTGDAGQRLLGGGQGALIGGGTAGLLGAGARALEAIAPPVSSINRVDPRELIAAARRQGVDTSSPLSRTDPSSWRSLIPIPGAGGRSVLPADVGGVTTGVATSGARQLPFASRPIVAGAERVQNRVGNRVSEIANSEGAPLANEQFGDFARTSLERFNRDSAAYAGDIYQGAREAAEGVPLQAQGALSRLDQHLAELRQTPETSAPLIAGLERLQSDLSQGNLSIDAIRRLRTAIREEGSTDALRGTDYQRRAREVVDDLSNDIATQLPPEAAAGFREGDRLWAERLDFIDDVENRLLGPRNDRSAEAIVRRLTDMSRGDSARTGRVLDTLNGEEGAVFRSSLINDMGRNPDGSFSLPGFLRSHDRLPERSRRALFRGGNYSAMEDLATVARGARRSSQYANTSNTAGAANVGQTIGATASGGAAFSTWGKSIPVELLTGRLLASARFARFLANVPSRAQSVRWLSRFASRNPELAPDIIPIQRALETGIPRAAAEDEQDGR